MCYVTLAITQPSSRSSNFNITKKMSASEVMRSQCFSPHLHWPSIVSVITQAICGYKCSNCSPHMVRQQWQIREW